MFKIEDLVKEVRRVAAKSPDHKAGKTLGQFCEYFDEEGNPSCLIGHALPEVGIDELSHAMNISGVVDLLDEFADDYNDAEWPTDEYLNHMAWLEAVQNAQDDNLSWSEAVEIADKHYHRT